MSASPREGPSRRQMLAALPALLPGIAIARAVPPAPAGEPVAADYRPTAFIESTHPAIVARAAALAGGAPDRREEAVRIHDFVRDGIAFGLAPAFYDMRASAVLEAGVGYCNTKSTLFQALLRARGFATRTRFVDLRVEVLRGLFDPGTDHVDHSWTEVHLGGRWLRLDSYVVDLPLARAARARLGAEGGRAGFGIGRLGTENWDGAGDSFIQAVDDGLSPPTIARDHGHFADVADFYARVPAARNRLSFFRGLLIRFAAGSVNAGIDRVRAAA